jgi:hypothetical protein
VSSILIAGASSIVFVHGLGGHPEKTWSIESANSAGRKRKWVDFRLEAGNPVLREETIFWPRDFLPKTIKNARIMTYGYNADPVMVWSAVEHVNIFQHSKDLVIALSAQRRDCVCFHLPVLFELPF